VGSLSALGIASHLVILLSLSLSITILFVIVHQSNTITILYLHFYYFSVFTSLIESEPINWSDLPDLNSPEQWKVVLVC
jgi:hypothetical protein